MTADAAANERGYSVDAEEKARRQMGAAIRIFDSAALKMTQAGASPSTVYLALLTVSANVGAAVEGHEATARRFHGVANDLDEIAASLREAAADGDSGALAELEPAGNA